MSKIIIKGEGMNNFGDLIKARRNYKKLTQIQLAEKAGVSVSTIEKIEQGYKQFSLEVESKILAALDIMPRNEGLINKVEIKSEFILVKNLFINIGMVTDCFIGGEIIKLNQMGGSYLIIGNNDAQYVDQNQPFAVMLDASYFVALANYLKDKFQAREIKPEEEVRK